MHETYVSLDHDSYDEYKQVCLNCFNVSSKDVRTSSNDTHKVSDCPFCRYDWQEFVLDQPG